MTLRAAAAALVLVAVLMLRESDRDRDGVGNRADQCARTPKGRHVDEHGCCSAARALYKGIQALSREKEMGVGEVWFLQQLLRVRNDAVLRERVERAVHEVATAPNALLVNSGARRLPLPDYAGRGIRRLMNSVLAPVGEPIERAQQFIADFVATEEEGYVLSHQLLVLQWARTVGLPVPQEASQHRRRILQRMAAEQAGSSEFTDLFAERAAVLLLYGSPRREEAERWVDVIVHAQRPEGHWLDPRPSSFTYDGQRAIAVHPAAHTTAGATAALGFFLHRFGS